MNSLFERLRGRAAGIRQSLGERVGRAGASLRRVFPGRRTGGTPMTNS